MLKTKMQVDNEQSNVCNIRIKIHSLLWNGCEKHFGKCIYKSICFNKEQRVTYYVCFWFDYIFCLLLPIMLEDNAKLKIFVVLELEENYIITTSLRFNKKYELAISHGLQCQILETNKENSMDLVGCSQEMNVLEMKNFEMKNILIRKKYRQYTMGKAVSWRKNWYNLLSFKQFQVVKTMFKTLTFKDSWI